MRRQVCAKPEFLSATFIATFPSAATAVSQGAIEGAPTGACRNWLRMPPAEFVAVSATPLSVHFGLAVLAEIAVSVVAADGPEIRIPSTPGGKSRFADRAIVDFGAVL